MLEATQSLPGMRAPAFPLQGCPVPAVLLAARQGGWQGAGHSPPLAAPGEDFLPPGTEPLSPKVCQENPVLSKARKLIFASFVSVLCVPTPLAGILWRGEWGLNVGVQATNPTPTSSSRCFIVFVVSMRNQRLSERNQAGTQHQSALTTHCPMWPPWAPSSAQGRCAWHV